MDTNISIRLIRNATIIVKYAGLKILIDPMLAEKETSPGFPGGPNSSTKIPMVDLPCSIEEILDVDAVFITHLHPDHWDLKAANRIPKSMPIYCQNYSDANSLKQSGFLNVNVFEPSVTLNGITFQKTFCQHGSDLAYSIPEVAAILGVASGVFINTQGYPSIYVVGDSIWTDDIEVNLKKLRPDIVILNAGNAQMEGVGNIIMGKEDVLKVHQLLPETYIIVTHLETVNLCLLTRHELISYCRRLGISNHVLVPNDGEKLDFPIPYSITNI